MATDGPSNSQDIPNLCHGCRRPTTQDREVELGNPDSCEKCKRNPELAWITQAAAAGLTQLAETLRSGIPSDQRGTIRVS
jgi:hypothetical protein